jgi:hypothetical protein
MPRSDDSPRAARPSRADYDFVVCGGGLSGLCAAIAAAREGLHVALVQDRPVLGGNSSDEIRVPVAGAARDWPWMLETGVLGELLDEERFRNPEPIVSAGSRAVWGLVLYEWANREPSLDLYLNTAVRAVAVDEEGEAGDVGEVDAGEETGRTGEVPETEWRPAGDATPRGSGRPAPPRPPPHLRAVRCHQVGTGREFEFAAPLFLDATGDGAVAALAGAEFRYGREARAEFNESLAPDEADDVVQGSSILFRTRDVGRPTPFHAPDWAVRYNSDEALRWRGHNRPLGGYWWMEIGGPQFHTIDHNERIRHELVRHILGLLDHAKTVPGHDAETLVLDWIGTVPGKRESRRIVGDLLLTENHLRERTLFPDRVAYGGWYIDLHAPGGILATGEPPEHTTRSPDVRDSVRVGPYSLPLRMLRCRDVRNLFLAGRDASTTHVAMGSTRIMGTCAVMGQAVAAAATVCHRREIPPDDLTEDDITRVQQLLLKQDCTIPAVRNADPDDLAQQAQIVADSAAALELPPGDDWLEVSCPTQQVLPLTAERLDVAELLLENRTGEPVTLKLTVRRRSDIWSSHETTDGAVAHATLEPTGPQWCRFNLAARIEPGMHALILAPARGVFWSQHRKPPPGTAVATFRPSDCWRFERTDGSWIGQAVRVEPVSRPFEAPNVASGVTRPESATNLWISDPRSGLPETLLLKFDGEPRISEVRLTFDNDLNREWGRTEPLFVAPELVRDYRIDAFVGGRWRLMDGVMGNRRRHRVHRIGPVEAGALRLGVLATNGAPSARVYEVRVYGP